MKFTQLLHFLFVLSGLLLCTSAKAVETQEIILHVYEHEDWWAQDNRSLSITPTATLEGNVLCIYTEKTLENARITVADAQGNVWFDAEESSLSGSYSFTLDGSPQGMLILRIETKEICYIGEFSL